MSGPRNKIDSLKETLEKVCENPNGENIFDLITTSKRVLSQGLCWDQIITAVEDVTGDNLQYRRSKKCPLCGGSVNIYGKCFSISCENYMDKEAIELFFISLARLKNKLGK